MTDLTVNEFIEKLGSTAAIPGGGGASAVAGALGSALGAMAASLTENKKKYADIQPRMQQAMNRLREISEQMLELVQVDADAFLPLSKAYGLPRDTEEQKQHRTAVMQAGLAQAALPPLDIMRSCSAALGIMATLVDTVSPLVVSDVGCGASMCRACMESASLNVLINANMLTDKQAAASLINETRELLTKGREAADLIFNKTEEKICS